MPDRYANLDGKRLQPRLLDLIRWKAGWHDERRPRTPGPDGTIPVVANDGRALCDARRDSLTWIGHASFLIQLGGRSILVDPVLSDSVGGLVRRSTPPGLDWPALPRIDAVLITHNHRDHLDEPTVKRLGPAPAYVVPMGMGGWFRRAGLARVTEMSWWQQEEIGDVRVTFVPAEHWSRRGAFDANTSWWGGYVLEHDGLRVYHAGDSAWFEGFAEIGRRCGAIDAAMLPIGSYAPRWFMGPQHVNPEEAVRAFVALGARRFIAMHWGTFRLADDDPAEPPSLLRDAWARAGLPDERLSIPAIGETLEVGQRRVCLP